MTGTLAGRLERAAEAIIGRETELTALRCLLDPDGPAIVFVHGIGGIGKSALVSAFSGEARRAGGTVVRLDSAAIEPTESGFLGALSSGVGATTPTLGTLATRLAELPAPVLLVVDGYELLRPIDPWLRQELVPGLPDTVRLLVAGREPPLAGWPGAFGELFRSLHLRSLAADDALELLRRAGIAAPDGQRINRFARGHPLALRLAAGALVDQPAAPEASPMTAIVEGFAEVYLARLDRRTRVALEAASVVRRPTLSLLAAMLPDTAPDDAFERLRALPFVEIGSDGLVVHDTIREVVAAYLRATDPDRARRYRVAAWSHLRDESRRASRQEMWRSTADLLYLLENPMIREAFFPTTEHRFFVDAAAPDDREAVLSIAREHEPPAPIELVQAWWARFPRAFRVARDASGAVVGWYAVVDLTELSRSLLDLDPAARQAHEHHRARPAPHGTRVLLYRFELAGGAPRDRSLVQAALVLDLKRMYMELRPALRRIYTVNLERVTSTSPWSRLGFEPIANHGVELDGVEYHVALLDFGPGSVDGWLERVIATELQIDEPALLDAEQRQLLLDGERVDLTRLEFELLRYLDERRGRVVDRRAILRDVWGHGDDGGSNVVEAVVRSVRHKLGDRRDALETVRGVGYRFTRPG